MKQDRDTWFRFLIILVFLCCLLFVGLEVVSEIKKLRIEIEKIGNLKEIIETMRNEGWK